MGDCDPGKNIQQLRLTIRNRLRVPKRYAKKMSKQNICSAFKECKKKSDIFPPMKMSQTEGVIMYIDPRSELNAKDYLQLFGRTPLKKDVRRIASKLGIIYNTTDAIDNIKNKIIQYLVNSKIAEPIQVPIKKEKNNFTSFTNRLNKRTSNTNALRGLPTNANALRGLPTNANKKNNGGTVSMGAQVGQSKKITTTTTTTTTVTK